MPTSSLAYTGGPLGEGGRPLFLRGEISSKVLNRRNARQTRHGEFRRSRSLKPPNPTEQRPYGVEGGDRLSGEHCFSLERKIILMVIVVSLRQTAPCA